MSNVTGNKTAKSNSSLDKQDVQHHTINLKKHFGKVILVVMVLIGLAAASVSDGSVDQIDVAQKKVHIVE
jgi:hypothetical protein